MTKTTINIKSPKAQSTNQFLTSIQHNLEYHTIPFTAATEPIIELQIINPTGRLDSEQKSWVLEPVAQLNSLAEVRKSQREFIESLHVL